MSSEGGTWARQTCGARRLKKGYKTGENLFSRSSLFVSINSISTRLTTCRIEGGVAFLCRKKAALLHAMKGE